MAKVTDYIVKYYEGKEGKAEEMETTADPRSGRIMAYWLANIKYQELRSNGKKITATKVCDKRWAEQANIDVTGYVISDGDMQYIFLVEPSEIEVTTRTNKN